MKRFISVFVLVCIFFFALTTDVLRPGNEDKRKSPSKETSSPGNTQKEQPILDILLVLDNSGSMKKNDPRFLTRQVVTNFLNGLGKDSRLGMVTFDQEARLAEPLTEVTSWKARAKFLKSLDTVNYKGLFTNSPAGIERAIYELKTYGRSDAQKVIIFLTDGIVDTGDKGQDLEKEKWLKEELVKESKNAGIRIIGIAFTDQADFRLIQTLAIKTGGDYFRAYRAEDIQHVFKKINEVITKPPAKTMLQAPSKTELISPPVQEPTSSQTLDQKKGAPLAIILAAIVALIIMVLRGRSSSPIGCGEDIGRSGHSPGKELPISHAGLIDVESIISRKSLVLDKKSMTIGRDSNNDIAIPKDTISSLHATIEYKDSYFYLEDQRSSNGTSLNNKKIEPNKPVRLKSGDRIKFDIYEFRFVLPDEIPRGKTRLSTPQDGRTVLRPSKSTESPSPEDLASPLPDIKPDVKDEPPLASPDKGSDQDSKTRIKPGMCPKHPARKATELCMVCKNAFCAQCMTEKNGKDMCVDCSKKP